ncbi:bifunctional folylpolyglutamate synthase/dihydrofolate synthase [Thermodesulfobacteriota bacterium]
MTMPSILSYNECMQAMFSLNRFGIKLGLSSIQNVLDGLGNPQNAFSCVHVAGTNGKGSIASALSTIFNLAGYKVGLYTSPHLVRFNERIRINGRPIDDDDVVRSYHAVKDLHSGERELTFFEYATAMALYEFGRQQIDWAIIETGMGGRLDATNIIQPFISIISNISLEHQMYLGKTVSQIAGEKGGIIKKKTPVITGVKQPKALSVIQEIARKKEAPLYRLGKDFRVRRRGQKQFSYFGMDHIWRDLKTGLLGNHQVDNAALVLSACEILNRSQTDLSLENISNGLLRNNWPGRLEIFSTSPVILLDGAHNLAAARNLARFLSENLKDRNITLVAGILDDKPYTAMLRYLLPLCSRAILTRAKIDRALPPDRLYDEAKTSLSDIQISPDVCSALKTAVETTTPEDVICIAGSLYVVGEAKEALDKNASFFNKQKRANREAVFLCE